MFRLTYFLPLIVLVSGCAGVRHSEPEEGPLSKVRFVTMADSITQILSYDDQTCTGEKEIFRLDTGGMINSAERNLGMPLNTYHKNSAKEVYVQAEKNMTARFRSRYTVSPQNFVMLCDVPFAYHFQEGKQYEARFVMTNQKTFSTEKSFTYVCHVELHEIVEKTDGPEMVLLKKFTAKDYPSPECEKRFKMTSGNYSLLR